MKPGDEGGSLPSTCLLRRRRRKKQHANKIAAIASTASGTPIPIPSFSRLVRPESLEAGASGSAVALELSGALELEEDIDSEEVDEDADEDGDEDADDAELEISLDKLLEDAVGVETGLELSDSDSVDDSEALVDNEFKIEESVFEAWDKLVSLGCSVTDAVTSVGSAPLAGGAAVAGPNSAIK
jgi:hypothetical protein